jgi:hypothetical protein
MAGLDGQNSSIDLHDAGTWRKLKESIYSDQAVARLAAEFDTREEFSSYYSDLQRAFTRYLRRGGQFQRALSIPAGGGAIRYTLIGASCKETPAICLLEYEDGQPNIRLHPEDIRHPKPGVDCRAIMQAPGDGRVTLASLTGAAGRAVPVGDVVLACAPHSVLLSDPAVIGEILTRLAR